jgi:hypothetical protein
MNVEIDYLIETTEKLLKRFEGTGEIDLGVVLLCALQLFKKEKIKESNREVNSMPS